MKVQMSSGVTALQRASHSAASRADAAGRQLLHRDRVLAGPGHPHHVLEQRQLVADLADLLHLLVVLDDHDLGVGVLEHVLALLGGVGLVDRDDDRAGRERREVEVGPLGPGVGEDRDLVALLDPEVDQAEGERADASPHLVEAAVDPLARPPCSGPRGRRRRAARSAAAGPRALSIWFPAPHGGGVYSEQAARRPSACVCLRSAGCAARSRRGTCRCGRGRSGRPSACTCRSPPAASCEARRQARWASGDWPLADLPCS